MDPSTSFELPTTSEWLPTMPTIGLRIIDMLADEQVAIVQLAKEIKVDPVLTAKILHIANSPLYRSKAEILSVEHAVSWLGKSEVAGLVLSLDLATFDKEDTNQSTLFNEYWQQSFIQGCAMSRIAESSGQFPQNEAYICGLLMDLGRLLMLDGNAPGYFAIVEESRRKGLPLHQIETQRMGRNHAEVGEELLQCMGLPEQFGRVAGLHCVTAAELEQHTEAEFFPLLAAAIASSAIGDFFCRNNQAHSLAIVESVCRKHMRMSESDIQWFMDSVNSDIEQKAELYSVDVKSMVPMGQLIGHTNGQIGNQSTDLDPTSQLQQEIDVLRRLVSNLEKKACHDSMTGIYNRDYWTAMLNERVNSSKFGNDPFAILVIDIDKFKSINDVHGHLTGDFAITWTARCLDSYLKTDLVARYGGDEFVAIVDYQSREELQARLDQLCREVEAEGGPAAKLPHPMTISIGGVLCNLNRPCPSLASRIFQIADEAMYQSKQAGGNSCHLVELDNETAEQGTMDKKPAALPVGGVPSRPVTARDQPQV